MSTLIGLGGEDGVERGGELRVPIADQEPEPADTVVNGHNQVAGLLGHPRLHWVRRHPEHMDLAGGDLDHKQHVQPFEQHGVHGEAGPPPAHPWPALGGTAATRRPSAAAPGQHRRAAGCSTRCWPQSCTRAGTARRGRGGSPRSGSLWPAAGPAGGARPTRRDGHAGEGRPSGAEPGRDASAAAWPAAPTVPARPSAAGAANARPAPRDRPSRSGVGYLSAEHRDLVAQHQQLRVLGRRAPRQQRKPSQQLAEAQIEPS
jgi:hypothetical protein